ncbi:UNVERIFIED_CONTAM: hypothetical protein Slati_0493800 [Sesamum latifolium]|uniref:Uncharacterized protein n=1 Tax=Sesamum latifolium TaxID=2727402 RepID=A0AAW2Y0K3_9LAMI
MRYKAWPHFPAWREIFGKDRAIGDGAEDDEVAASIARGERQTTPEPDYVPTADCNPEHGFVSNNEDEAPFPNINIDSTSPSTNAHKESSGSGSKKRPRRVGIDAEERLVDMVGTFCKDANSRISSLTKVLEREFGNEENSDQVEDAVAEVEGLDENEQLVIIQRLHNNPKDLHLLF